jgi:hypothetical protein
MSHLKLFCRRVQMILNHLSLPKRVETYIGPLDFLVVQLGVILIFCKAYQLIVLCYLLFYFEVVSRVVLVLLIHPSTSHIIANWFG